MAGVLVVGASSGLLLDGATAVAAGGQGGPETAAGGDAAPMPHEQKPSRGVPLAPRDDVSGFTAVQQKSLRAARGKAAATGKPVRIDALTTETSTTTANPSGTLTWNSSLLPTRVRKSGTWVGVDASLIRNSDGSYSPTAAAGSLRLSGGGTAPLAVMGSRGRQLAFSWPKPLPAPIVSGAQLTFRDILADVDLRVTATTQGGFSDVLVVKSAAAANNPALASLSATAHGSGVVVRDDGQRNLEAVTRSGDVAFSSSRPIMWDSARTKGSSTAAGSTSTSRGGVADTAPPGFGPTPGAHVANVGTRLSSGKLSLSLDRKLLTQAGIVYPLLVGPAWNPHPASGSIQHWNEVQAGCPTTTSNYDATTYGDPGVGNNTYSGCIGVERSYFQLGVPSAIWGTDIVSASINMTETYAAQCGTTSTIHMYLTPAIDSKFSWNTKPKPGAKIHDQSFKPACTSYTTNGFDATGTVDDAAAGHWHALAFVLINDSESDGNHFKRFQHNPSMSITYNSVPNTPAGLQVKLNAATYACATAMPYPILGKTVATTAPILDSVSTDPDQDMLAATYSYWVGSATHATMTSAAVSSGQHAPVPFPSTYIKNLPDGSIVNWQVSVTDGKDTKANTSTCHFTVDQRAPVEPTVSSDIYPDLDASGGAGAPAGTSGTFTAKVDPGSTNNNASKFVFGLDAAPPTSGAPANQTVAAVNNTASYKAAPVSPGTHTLFVYAIDSAGNESPQHEYHFTAVGHAPKTYASLSAAFNNTAVSDNAAMSAADADGSGHSFSSQDLQAAGWKPGQPITIDGAKFTLPAFGSGTADNVLAANQTITMNSQHGNALVFLATSTSGRSAAAHVPADHSSPYVPDGTNISATDCVVGNNSYSQCSEATGTVTYADGTTAPQSYYLPVPDWSAADTALSAIFLAHQNGLTGQISSTLKIYAFAVPIAPGAPISSVTLPDLSDVARTSVPGLHIFGMAVRDTTTAPGGASWTGAWGSPTENGAYNWIGQDFRDQTFRLAATPSVSGSSARIKFSNRGGVTPLNIDHATIGIQASGSSSTGTPVNLTFGGAAGVVLPVGGETYSDPLNIPVTANHPVLVSFHIPDDVPYIVEHTYASNAVNYLTSVGSGDHTTDTATTAFDASGHWGYYSDVVAGIDVVTTGNEPTIVTVGDGLVNASTSSGNVSPGIPNGGNSWRISGQIAAALQSHTQDVDDYGVVASDIQGNHVTDDEFALHGGSSSLLSRLDRDVLSVPNVKTVVVAEGLEDIVSGDDDAVITTAYQTLLDQLQAWGIKAVVMNLTPCDGYAGCTAAADENRQAVNQWVSDVSAVIWPGSAFVDANAAVAVDDPNSTTTPTEQQLSAQAAPLDFDSGDHVNLSVDGYAAVSRTLTDDLTVLAPLPKP